MFEYTCKNGHITEELFFVGEKIKAWMKCQCGKRAMKQIPLTAKMTHMWMGQCETNGVNGYYDAGLGCTVHSAHEADKIAKEKGLVRETDLGSHWWDDNMNKQKADADKHNATVKTYQDNIKKFDGNKEKAVQETFPAHEMLAEGD